MKRKREEEHHNIDETSMKQKKTEEKQRINQEKDDIHKLKKTYRAEPSMAGEEKENAVGINIYLRSYINQVKETFSGITKQRYSDFIVREISEDGKVAKILEDNIMKDDEEEESDKEEESLTTEHIQKGCDELENIPGFDKNNKEAVRELLLEIISDRKERGKNSKKVVQTKVTLGLFAKEHRIKVHQTVRGHFGDYLESHTDIHNELNTNIKKVLELKEANLKSNSRRNEPKFCKFILQKTNCSSADAVRLLAKMFRCNDKKFDVAGTKDKRAITTQFMTAFKLTPDRMREVFGVYTQDKLAIDPIEIRMVKEKLRLGDLKGNQFEIGLRNLTSTSNLKKVIDEAVESMKTTGFINYFGMQRFGNFDIMTHEMGIHLLRNDIKSVIACMLLSRTTPESYYTTMRLYLEKEHAYQPELGSHEWTEAHQKQLRLLVQAELTKARMFNEKRVIDHLFKNPNDYLGAFMKLSRNSRMMYAHAVQSYVWNHAASERIRQYGVKMVIGDIVSKKDSKKDYVLLTKDNFEAYVQQGYTIKDVVLPLFGFELSAGYPTHAIGEHFVNAFFDKHALSLETISTMKKQYCLFGAYRHVIIQPENVSHRLTSYSSIEDDIMQTPEDDSGNALVIKFDLPCGVYATMLLRELMHMPSILDWDKVNKK